MAVLWHREKENKNRELQIWKASISSDIKQLCEYVPLKVTAILIMSYAALHLEIKGTVNIWLAKYL